MEPVSTSVPARESEAAGCRGAWSGSRSEWMDVEHSAAVPGVLYYRWTRTSSYQTLNNP